MKFSEALDLIKKGKKVRRPHWKPNSYIYSGGLGKILYTDGTPANLYCEQLEATDWEEFSSNWKLEDSASTWFNYPMDGGSVKKVNYYREDNIKKALRNLFLWHKGRHSAHFFDNYLGPIINEKIKQTFGKNFEVKEW